MSLQEVIQKATAYLDPMQVDCLVYHHPCNDGTGAAVSAWAARTEDLHYIPLDYTKDFDAEQLRGKTVVLIDCSFKAEQLQSLRKIAKKIMILDHHESAQKNLHDVTGCFFSMENSGAVLAWHYFNGFANPVPKFIQLIQDRDLWRWQYRAESEPLFYALSDMYQIPNYKDFSAYLDAAALQQAIEHGKKLISKIKAWCQLTADKAELHSFSDKRLTDFHKCVVIALEVNSDQYVSELAEEIYTRQHADIVMLWHRLADNKYKMSFRNDNPAVNLSDLAQILGGGGHPRASGATVDYMPSDLLGDPRKPLN